MWMHGVENFFLGGFELLGHHQFADHLGGHGADQVGTQEFAVLCIEDELDEAIGLIGGQGSAAELKRELADAARSCPASRAAFSVKPTLATPGSV